MGNMKNFYSAVIDSLKIARDRFGSASALADRVGVNRVTLNRWLSGERNPTVLEVGKVFDSLGINFDTFIQRAVKPLPSGGGYKAHLNWNFCL